jgi:alkylation response protein AidB-like acyl-CoA dehydrogenase
MSQDPQRWISYRAITELAGVDGATCDRNGLFPERSFDGLRRLGLIGKPPMEPLETKRLLRVLAAVGRGNLSVGRIYEGHVNALLLIRWFGTASQRKRLETCASGGDLFGVWNSDLRDDPAHIENGILRGAKSFASGVDGLTYAVITVPSPAGRQMLIIPVKELSVDRSWWKPLGMRASGSHIVSFNEIIEDDFLLGAADDYLREPRFSAGIIRCAGVHVGGTHAIFDATVEHLKATDRANDPLQKHRLGQIATEVATGYAWLDYAAAKCASMEHQSSTSVIACMNAARGAIERAALNALELAERAVGVAGMMSPHPLERLMRDLRTYLRQPNPDGALAAIGAAVIDGAWSPDDETPATVLHA